MIYKSNTYLIYLIRSLRYFNFEGYNYSNYSNYCTFDVVFQGRNRNPALGKLFSVDSCVESLSFQHPGVEIRIFYSIGSKYEGKRIERLQTKS